MKQERIICPVCKRKIAKDKTGKIAGHRFAQWQSGSCPASLKNIKDFKED